MTEEKKSSQPIRHHPTLEAKAAILFYKINKGHIFPNGNKRISLACLFIFLASNGYELSITEDEATTKALEVAQSDPKKFDNVKKEKFTVTALPEKYSDSTYRYFLETWKKRAIEKDSLIKADELFVVCEKKCDPIIGNPQWDIAFFAPNKIVDEWKVSDVKIYKLVR